jgi:peptide-methionine (R)-S-oxide reductase
LSDPPDKITLGAMRNILLFIVGGVLMGCQPREQAASHAVVMKTNEPVSTNSTNMQKVVKSDAEWRQQLTPEQYHVLREAGTERPNGPAYEEFKQQGEGTYVCGGCGAELFSSKEKFDSHCGWPSFYDPANAKNVVTREDTTVGMKRVEVLCALCGGHLGHVFKGEGFPTPTDTRYCINGVALKFVPASTKQ